MTKQNMITDIQAKEAALWLELAIYDHRYAPVGCSKEAEIAWEMSDPGHLKKLYAWSAVNGLMESLGIDAGRDSSDYETAYMLRDDLWTRRQAAKGIYYN